MVAAGLAFRPTPVEVERVYCASVDPGAYAAVPVIAPDRWADKVHAMIDDGDLEEYRKRYKVGQGYLHGLVDELAKAADNITGRSCMPGHQELGATLGRPLNARKLAVLQAFTGRARAKAERELAKNRARHVTNATNVLEDAGLLVLVEEGRQLTLDECLQLRADESQRRNARAVYALTAPASCALPAAKPLENASASVKSVVPIFHPPRSGKDPLESSCSSELKMSSYRAEGVDNELSNRLTASKAQRGGRGTRPTFHPRALVLADGLRSRVPMLRDEQRGRLLPALTRFARAGWTATELIAALDQVTQSQRMDVPVTHPQPAVWLARRLRWIDHQDSPGVWRKVEKALERDIAARRFEPVCPHGEPGGGRPRLIAGTPPCPHCRRGQP